MTAVRLIAIDVDGTLLDSSHRLRPANARALRDAIQQGVEVVLASARSPRALAPVLAACGIANGYAVSYQGALTLEVTEGSAATVREQRIDLPLAQELVARAVTAGGDVNWYSGNRWLTPIVTGRVRREAKIIALRPEVSDLRSLTQGPHKLLILGEPSGDSQRLGALQNPAATVEISKPGYTEIVSQRVSKGQALLHLLADLKIERSAAVAVGDGANDVAMFAVAGHSVAMRNAPHDVRAAASEVTSSNDEDGVAHVIRRLVLS